MSEKENGKPDQESGQSEGQAESQPEGYPPTSVSFDDVDTVNKSRSSSEGDTVDLSREADSDSRGDDPNPRTDDTE